MPPTNDPPGDPAALAEAVARCRQDEALLSGVEGVLAEADAAAASRGAECRACGECCRFDLAGHRLYATTGELALLTRAAPPEVLRALRCPYQVGGQCTARDGRPLGCRAFFCDDGLADWSAALYERLHRKLRRLHRRRGAAYAYVELTAALADVFAAGAADGPMDNELFSR